MGRGERPLSATRARAHLLLIGLHPVPMAALTLLRLVAPVLLWATYGSSARI